MEGGQEHKDYYIKVDEKLLTSFFLKPYQEATKEEIRELNKMIMVVINKHYLKYRRHERELRALCMLAILDRHPRFNPKFRAFNYLYTLCRNEIGNKIAKYSREEFSDDMAGEYDRAVELPESFDGIQPVLPYLTGEKGFTQVVIPKGCLFDLLTFIEGTLSKACTEDVYRRVAGIVINSVLDE